MKRFFFFAFFFFPSLTLASGYQNAVISASDLSAAFAGAGSAIENVSAQSANPASLARLKGWQFSAGWALDGQNIRFQGQSVLGNGGNAGTWRNLPHFYFSAEVHPKVVLGLAAHQTGGWKNHYNTPWQAQDWLIQSQMRVENVVPSVAWRVSDKWSAGAAVTFSRLKWKWQNTHFSQSAADHAYGVHLGILLTPSDSMNVSLSYQSPIRFKGSNWRLKTPGRFAISTWQQLNRRWELMGSVAWTKYSQDSALLFNDPTLLYQPLFSNGSGLRIAWGTAYLLNPQWKLKWGVAYDQSPLKVGERTPALPIHDQWWFSLGLRWAYSDFSSVDLAYSYVYASKSDVRLPRLGLSGRFKTSAHVWGLQYSVCF